MSVSSFIGSPLLVLPKPSSSRSVTAQFQPSNNGGLVIECSSRPKKKATAHHMKTRPKKSQPWDIRRKPTVYPPLPALPPEWTLVSDQLGGGSHAELEAPTASG